MFLPDQYCLLDFGEGRKLERFGDVMTDRPCPIATVTPVVDPSVWRQATRFERSEGLAGRWVPAGDVPQTWSICHGPLVFELKRTDVGHVGLFPEQGENWDWLQQVISADRPDPFYVLNLFAYTGGSTLACAAAGAHVSHVDAAGNTVKWARRNAAHSGMTNTPIRWIVEDARKFVRREIARRRIYHGIILDPPSFGRGPKGHVWSLETGLPGLLRDCMELAGRNLRFVLITCHSTGFTAERLLKLALKCWPAFSEPVPFAGDLSIQAAHGRKLPAGVVLRWRR